MSNGGRQFNNWDLYRMAKARHLGIDPFSQFSLEIEKYDTSFDDLPEEEILSYMLDVRDKPGIWRGKGSFSKRFTVSLRPIRKYLAERKKENLK